MTENDIKSSKPTPVANYLENKKHAKDERRNPQKRKANWNIWNINVYKVFTVADTSNPLLFTMTEIPVLHPNIKGYDTLATMVLDSMKATLR